jgi:protein-tyrosine phosphatase
VSTDPTRIALAADPRTRRMTGTTAHGFIPFDVPFISEIAPNLWQGGCENGLPLPAPIRHLVSLYPWESYKVKHELDSTVAVRMHDSTEQAMEQIPVLAAWVNACRKNGPVLVHCQAGLNRSSLVVAMALMLEGSTADAAIALIRSKRSPACLCNPMFEQWLRAQKAARKSYEAECTRVYTRRGRVSHLLPLTQVLPRGSVLCPVEPPWDSGWLGTGSQREHDRAASLPVCANCWWRARAEDDYRTEPSQFRPAVAS